jgi:Domain of unknown function (DUF4365)
VKSHTYDQGNAGEAVAAYYLSVIFNGETSRETLRGEGMGALDFQLKFPTAYPTDTFLQLAVQVKSGPSFADWTKSKNRWRLQHIDKGHINKWRATNQPVLLIWVRLDPQLKPYWKLISSKTPLETISVSESHVLNPASRFEIERLLHVHGSGRRGVPKITVPEHKSTSDVRKWAKAKYQTLKGTCSRCLGDVTVSSYAWRHLTRVTRPQSHIQDSLAVLPMIRSILSATPHQVQTLSAKEQRSLGRVTVTRKVLALYRDVRFSDKGVCVVYVRLDERVEYREDWLNRGLIRQVVSQDLKLESVFRKPTKHRGVRILSLHSPASPVMT